MPSLSERQLQALVAAHLGDDAQAPRVIAYHAPLGWDGGQELQVRGHSFRVVRTASVLETRQALTRAEASRERLVLLTAAKESELGEDVRARLAGVRLLSIEPWEAVRELFGGDVQIDPLLQRTPELAEHLIAAAPADGYPKSASSWLSYEQGWQIVLDRVLGLPPLLDAAALLRWTVDGPTTAFLQAPQSLRSLAAGRAAEICGPLAPVLLERVAAGARDDLVPLGLACAALYAPGTPGVPAPAGAAALPPRLVQAVQAARVHLQYAVGGQPVSPSMGTAWAGAAEEVAESLLRERKDAPVQARLQRADALLESFQAADATWLSPTSPKGFEHRLEAFGRALGECLSQAPPAPSASLLQALDSVREHRAARLQPERAQQARMACRLLRWLGRGEASLEAASLPAITRLYEREGAYVDRARTVLRGTRAPKALAASVHDLLERVRTKREKENRAFAEALASANAAGSWEGVLPLESVLSRVVAPLAQHLPVLLLVLDGISWPICTELLESLTMLGWVERAPDAEQLAPALSCLPSITEVSRASLLSGGIARGQASFEKKAFAESAPLLAHSAADRPPCLIHKGDLDLEGAPWLNEVSALLGDEKQRIVGVVVNAVDDHLAKDDQLRHEWSVETIPPLRPLLDLAVQSGRVVVLASDHGHVLEAATELRPGEGGERWRAADGGPAADEIELSGGRVAVGGRICLPWSERVRYGGKKWGYHGGASPQEVVAPLAVLAPAGQAIPGWTETPRHAPDWWELDLPRAASTPARKTPAAKKTEIPVGQMSFIAEEAAPPVGDETLDPVLSASAFKQRLQAAPPEAATEIPRLLRLLAAGPLKVEVLTRSFARPREALLALLDAAARVVSIEGYSVLRMGFDGETVHLDVAEMARRFMPESGHVLEVETAQGNRVEIRLPCAPTPAERAALLALAKHGTVAEAALRKVVNTRRVGFMETLLERLARADLHFIEAGEVGSEGRVYIFRGERLKP